MSDAIDKALEDGLLAPPADFAARVMAELPARPGPTRHRHRPRRRRTAAREIVEWLALAGAVLAGSAQLIGLLFGIWMSSNAG